MRKLTAIVARRDKPGMVVSDKEIGLASNAISVRRTEAAIAWHYTALGKGTQNGYVESFREPMRDQMLIENLLLGFARRSPSGLLITTTLARVVRWRAGYQRLLRLIATCHRATHLDGSALWAVP